MLINTNGVLAKSVSAGRPVRPPRKARKPSTLYGAPKATAPNSALGSPSGAPKYQISTSPTPTGTKNRATAS